MQQTRASSPATIGNIGMELQPLRDTSMLGSTNNSFIFIIIKNDNP